MLADMGDLPPQYDADPENDYLHLDLHVTNADVIIVSFHDTLYTVAQISVSQQGDFGNNIRDYLRLPACLVTKTESDSEKKSTFYSETFFLGGVKVVIFDQSENDEYS